MEYILRIIPYISGDLSLSRVGGLNLSKDDQMFFKNILKVTSNITPCRNIKTTQTIVLFREEAMYDQHKIAGETRRKRSLKMDQLHQDIEKVALNYTRFRY